MLTMEQRRRLGEKAARDEGLRALLRRDPRAAIRQELGIELPEGVRIEVVEETATTRAFVMPWDRLSAVAGTA